VLEWKDADGTPHLGDAQGNRRPAVFLRPHQAPNGRALVGERLRSPVSFVAGTPTLLCARPPRLASGCQVIESDKGGRSMHPVPARPEQTPSPLFDVDVSTRHERQALEQQRAELVRALDAAERSIKTFLPGSLEWQKARARATHLHTALWLLKGKLGTKKRYDLGELLIELFRQRVTPSEWQRIIGERHNGGLMRIT
jgi:hypothetical protein